MSSDNYQVQNVHRYVRKSYKIHRGETPDNNRLRSQDDSNVDSDLSPRSDRLVTSVDLPGCSCDIENPSQNIASILHKKCPVIGLARHQLHVLDEINNLLCDNTGSFRSVNDFLRVCYEIFLSQKCTCSLLFLIVVIFFLGLTLGAASCGSHLGQFNSPLLMCLDNLFAYESSLDLAEYRGIT